jgi:hypothetical protein
MKVIVKVKDGIPTISHALKLLGHFKHRYGGITHSFFPKVGLCVPSFAVDEF